MDIVKTMVVNLIGAPGAGKSTGAAYIFSKLKMEGINCELVTEFAKDKVWEESVEVFKNQLYIFGKQAFKLSRCKDKVDIIVTDSPLFLSMFYANQSEVHPSFKDVVMFEAEKYLNLNYFINRSKAYNPIGRMQTEAESDEYSERIRKMCADNDILFLSRNGDSDGYDSIVEDIVHYHRFCRVEEDN